MKAMMANKNKEFDSRNWRILTFVLGITFLTYASFFNFIFTSIIGGNGLDTLLALMILFISLTMCFLSNKDVLKSDFLILLVVLFLIFIFDYFHPKRYETAQSRIWLSLLQKGVWGYFFARILKNKDEIYSSLKYIAAIIFISAVAIPFLPKEIQVLFGGEIAESYGAYMFFGYCMLPATIIYLYLAFKERKIPYILFAAISTFEILLFGNRGALLSVVCFLGIYLLFFFNIKQKGILIIILGICVALTFYFTSERGVRNLIVVVDWLGLRSRNLEKLLEATIQESGREDIYEITWQYINNNIFGVGITGSWLYGYPHNLFLEILLQFGVIGGGALLMLFIGFSAKVLFKNRGSDWGEIYLIFFGACFTKLLFSGSYLTDWWFWVMLGMLVTCLQGIKRKGNA